VPRRPLGFQRQNALLVGSDEGDDNWAVIATLVENYKIVSINSNTWLTEAVTKLSDVHTANSLSDLMP
jgi:transposase